MVPAIGNYAKTTLRALEMHHRLAPQQLFHRSFAIYMSVYIVMEETLI